jgi:hypothetical protein
MPKRKKTEGRNSVDLATDFYSNPNANLVAFESIIKSASPPPNPWAKSKNITIGSGARTESWDKSSRPARIEMNKIARLLGKTTNPDGSTNVPRKTLHSGYRSNARQKAAMLKIANVGVYNKKYFRALTGVKKGPGSKALTPEQIKSRPIGPKSSKEDKRLRTSAVDRILKTLTSPHTEGRGWDFSYEGMTGDKYPGTWKKPSGEETEAALKVRAQIEQISPGANVVLDEKPTLHIHVGVPKIKEKSLKNK